MSAPRGRCANEENARAFHQGPDTVIVHREAGYIDAALFSSGASRDTPLLSRRLGPYIILCSTRPGFNSCEPLQQQLAIELDLGWIEPEEAGVGAWKRSYTAGRRFRLPEQSLDIQSRGKVPTTVGSHALHQTSLLPPATLYRHCRI